MTFKKIILSFGFTFAFVFTNAQTLKFSDEPEQFITDIYQMMEATTYEVAIQAAVNFDSAWVSLTGGQKTVLISIAQKMAKKRLKPIPNFQNFLNAIFYAVHNESIDSQILDTFLTVMYKVLDRPENSNALISKFLAITKLFFEKKALYDSNYNSVFVIGGTYAFDYIEPEEEKTIFDEYDEILTQEEEEAESEDDWEDDDWGWEDEGWGDDSEDDFATSKQRIEALLGDIEYSAEDAAAEQPPIQGPVIIFKNTNIALRTNYGSNQIQGTNGTFMFYNNIFTGDSGKFDWSTVGISPATLYCEFKEYNFNVKSPTLKADSVTLHYPEVVDYPVEGIFEFQSKKYSNPLKAQYPKFKSYSNDIKIKNFGKNMIYKGGMALIYKGGLALAGNRMNSSSVIGGNCEMSFIGKNKLMFRLLAKKFELGDSLIATKNAYFVLYQYEDSLMDGNRVVFQRKDSIVHPKVKLKYNKNTAMLKLVTGGSTPKHTAFSDSYHNIDIRAEFLHWDLKTPYVNFSIITAKHKVPAFFESREYYDPVRYKQMQGILSFHPLQMVVMYGRLNGKKEFFADHIARDYKKNVNTIKSTCVALHKQGFIDFNTATGLIKLKPKGIHYVYASMGRADFDNMLIRSLSPSGKNATLDLSNNELTVRGIRKFYLSDSMRVFVLPQGNQIKILKDRNLLFNGMLRAGNMLFYGQDFKFDYDGFYVVLKQVDSLKFRLDKVGVLDNQMVFKGGILYINKPNNRSGRKKFPEYPKLAAPLGGKVYFDRDKVLNHAYDKSMYFEIPAFDLDSLNSYDPATFNFAGTFYSGGIFPPFQERLQIMPDYSLGFTHKVPYGGYKLYGKDDAMFYDQLTLNNEGLRGPGEIKYLMATLKSDDFVFYLDSVLTIATGGYIQKGNYNEASCPQVTYDRCFMKWLPELGMYLSNTDIQTPILLYEGDATLDGTTLLTATGLYGIGKVSTSDAETISDKFHFKENDFSARRATFKIASDNPKKPALLCTSIRLDFDMQNLLAGWTPEIKGFPSTEFPYSQYKTSIEKGLLDLNKRTVTMHMPEGSDIKNSYFYSTHPDQDSLAFNATGAIYDMDELTLNINGIPEIRVADVFIVPDSNKIFVLENAKIPMLTRAEITMDTLNGYHQLHSGNILINSRNEFEGNAIYDFVNLANDTFRIKFDKFVIGKEAKKKKDLVSTAAHGKVLEEDSIFISPKIFYRGKVALHADKDNLDVDGFIKLQMIGIFKSDNWFKYTNQEDIFNVSVKVKDLVSAQGKPLSTGLHINQRTSQLYSTFISQKYQNTDKDVLPAKGMLYIDPFKSEFKITTPEKETGLSYQGNVMVYHDSTSEIDYEGKLSLVTIRNDNKSFVCDASGSGSAYFSSYDTIYTTDTLFTIDNLTFRKLMQFYDTLYTNDTIYTNDSQFYLPSSLFHLPTKALTQAGLPPRITNPNYIFHLPVPGYSEEQAGLLSVDTLLSTSEILLNTTDTLYTLDPFLNPDTLFISDTLYSLDSLVAYTIDTLIVNSYIIDTVATNQYSFNTFLSFNFDFPTQALKLMGENIVKATAPKSLTSDQAMIEKMQGSSVEDQEPGKPNDNDSTLIYRLAEIIGNEKAKEYKQHLAAQNSPFMDYEYSPLYTFSNKLNKSIVFSDVTLKWSNEYKAWYSVGKLGLSNILKNDINAEVNGYLQMSKTPAGDKVDIYIELGYDKWYYFHYDNTSFWYKMSVNMPINKLIAISSDLRFNDIIASKAKGDRDVITEDKYAFALGDLMDKALFIRKFKSKYLGEGAFEQEEDEDDYDETYDEEEYNFDDSEIMDMRMKAGSKPPKKKKSRK